MKHLEKSELTALLTEAKRCNELHWLAFLTAYWHGLRVSEVLSLTPADFKDGFIVINRKKGSKKTVQPLVFSTDLLYNERDALKRVCASIPIYQRIFPFSIRWMQKFMHKYGERVGIPAHKRSPHKLKHSIAHHCLDGGMKINELQAYLGHCSLNSTGQYLKCDQDQACKAMGKALGV